MTLRGRPLVLTGSDCQAEMHVPRLFAKPDFLQRVRRRRSAFTLVELLVSLGVLSIALAVIGTVFSITTQTASQASAYSATQSWLRRFVMELEADLKGIVRSQSVLVIRGRTIPAGMAPGDIEAEEPKLYRVLVGNPLADGLQNALSISDNDPSRRRDLSTLPLVIQQNFSDLRADQIMFLTNRPLASRAPAWNVAPADHLGLALQNGTRFSPAFVTYGHAALAEAYYDSGQGRYLPQPPSQWRHINQRRAPNGAISNNPSDPSRVPAQQWVLARRQMIVIDDPSWSADPGQNLIPLPNWTADDTPDGGSILFGLGGSDAGAGQTVFGAGQSLRNAAGDAIRMNLTMPSDSPPPPYFGPGLLARLSRPYSGLQPPARVNPYPMPPGIVAPNSAAPAPVPNFAGNLRTQLLSLMYPNGDDSGASTNLGPQTVAVAIPNPPPDLRANLNLQALPGCVWFQVEFLQPEDPRNHPEYFDWTPENPSDNPNPSDAQRWVSVPNGAIWTFVPDTPENRQSILDGPSGSLERSWDDFGPLPRSIPAVSGGPGGPPPVIGDADYRDYIRVRTFPYAIRITVRATDPKGRLAEPIVRTVVHRFD
jgi:hypothetical protein